MFSGKRKTALSGGVFSIVQIAITVGMIRIIFIIADSYSAGIAQIMGTVGLAPQMLAAVIPVLLAQLFRAAAGRARIAALGVTMLLAVAQTFAAVLTPLMIGLDITLTVHRIDARTMIGVSARRLMAAEGSIAPKQTAHSARRMRIGAGAPVFIAAAALRRITEMLLITLTDHVLRNRIAILAHRLVLMLAAFADVMTFHAAGRQLVRSAVAGKVSDMSAGCRHMILVVLRAVTIAAALRSHMIKTIAGIVRIDAAGRALMLHTVADGMAGKAAGSRAVLAAVAGIVCRIAAGRRRMVLAVAGIVRRIAAGRRLMISAVRNTVTGDTAHRHGMLTSIAAKVTANAAERRFMIALAGNMASKTAGRAAVLHAVAGVVAGRAALRLHMTLAVKHAMIRKAAGSRSMRLLVAGIVAFGAAGIQRMILAVAVKVTPGTTGCTLMVHAITIEMALDPAGLRTIMLLSVPLGMLRIAARRLAAVIRRKRARHHAHQQAQRQQERNHLLHHWGVRLLISFPVIHLPEYILLTILYISLQFHVNSMYSVISIKDSFVSFYSAFYKNG